ncbi:hypothetical protein FACS189419_02710 [Planctomycetales bacterium]|nr:hypothetical protein FACS189419_02710 [Planctomycetales bacterium]
MNYGDYTVEFIFREQSSNAKHPQVLFAGSSLCNMGFSRETFENNTRLTTAKISHSGIKTHEVLDILKHFPKECSSAKILILELCFQRLGKQQSQDFRRVINAVQVKFIPTNWEEYCACRMPIAFFYKGTRRVARNKLKTGEEDWYSPEYAQRSDDLLNDRNLHGAALQIFKEGIAKVSEYTPGSLLRSNAQEVRQARMSNTPRTYVTQADMDDILQDKAGIEAAREIAEICRERGMFLLIAVPPLWYGLADVTQSDLDKPCDNEYVQLLQELNRQPHCSVIIARDFEEITGRAGNDEEYLFDYGHMRKEGAVVYTNWLVDRMFKMPKVAETLQRDTRIR